MTETVAKDGTDGNTGSKASPEALLKAAVAEARGASAPMVAPLRKKRILGLTPRALGAVSGALGVGLAIGALSTAGGRSHESVTRLDAGLEANRLEASRLNGEIERLARSFAGLRETIEAGRIESRALGTTVSDRLTRLEQSLDGQTAAFGARLDQAGREQASRQAALNAQVEKKLSMLGQPAATAPSQPVVAAKVETRTEPKVDLKAEPTQTGSIVAPKEATKPKPDTVENWALREVYDGVAVLEDRKRRLVEVGLGDTVPGIGRVESIERRGRMWVVMTRQGPITPQAW